MNSSLVIVISSVGLVFFSFLVVFLKNPIHSALSLVASFAMSSVIAIFFNSEFFALLFLLIYSGAVVVLFLFVLMMLDLKQRNFKTGKFYLPLSLFFVVFLLLKLQTDMFSNFKSCFEVGQIKCNDFNYYYKWWDSLDFVSDVNSLSLVLYEYCHTQTLIVGFLLFVVVLGVSHLTAKKTSNLTNQKQQQSLTRQLTRQVSTKVS